jgi:hypothetical protein
MIDCMEHCSRFRGDGEGCFGVVWVKDNQNCWIRNSTTGTQNLKQSDGNHAALLVEGQMGGFDTKCPAADASTNQLAGVDGMSYTMNCNKVVIGFDTCFSGMAKPCLDEPYRGFFHTSTLDECLKICVDQHPLCKAVSWAPDLKIGFANCWPKTGFPEGGLQSPGPKSGTIHTATLTQIDPIDNKCPDAKTYNSKNAKFDIHCGKVISGTNITSMHTQNITSCMDACATYDQKCVGIVFDSSLSGGFKNCYLQNTTNTVSDQASATYAAMSSGSSNGNGNNSGDSTNTNDSSSSSSSKAWIAGPVLGGIAAIALIAFLIFFIRRRKARKTGAQALEKDGHEFGGYSAAPAYSPTGGNATGYYDAPHGVATTQGRYDAPMQQQQPPPLMELSGQAHEPNELPGTTKYAHAKAQPTELP